MQILKVTDMTKDFGGLRAVDNLSLTIETGQILGLIGPNGAGKSTAFNCIAGVFAPTSGIITFAGEKINGRKPWHLCKSGLARTFQIVKPFASKSVLYNVTVGSFISTNSRGEAEARRTATVSSRFILAPPLARVLHLHFRRPDDAQCRQVISWLRRVIP